MALFTISACDGSTEKHKMVNNISQIQNIPSNSGKYPRQPPEVAPNKLGCGQHRHKGN
uniref:Uncharacterized protein n=1 Tax=Solanum tuberosum TaxID=4113 RepID=M1BF13_SOLTU